MNNSSFSHDNFGVLGLSKNANEEDHALLASANTLIGLAEKRKKIPKRFDDMYWGQSGKTRGKKIGDALHHEIYDIAPNGKSVLMCCRTVEGDRYGQRTVDKEYFLICVQGKGVRVIPASKALAGKAAKSTEKLGDAISVVSGKTKYIAPANRVRKGYKLVTRDDDGELVSVWDGSSWALGKTRVEAATENHRGGFYYYASMDKAISAAETNETFGNARLHHDLVLIEVEASGRHFEHGNQKLCATCIKPIREVQVIN